VLEPEECLRNLTARNSLLEVLGECHQCPAAICPKLCKYGLKAASGRLSSHGQLQIYAGAMKPELP